METEYVKVTMFYPFGRDAYHECYVQINGNEDVIEFLYKTFKKNKDSGIEFKEIYYEREVDTIISVYGDKYSGSYDVENYVKLKGKLNIDIKTKILNVEKWWENLVWDAKHPKFEKIAEKVINSNKYKETDRQKYKPKDYRVLKPKNNPLKKQ